MTPPQRRGVIVAALMIVVFVPILVASILAIVHFSVRNSDAFAITEKRYLGTNFQGLGTVDAVDLKPLSQMQVKKGMGKGIARFTAILRSGEKKQEVRFHYRLANGTWTLVTETPAPKLLP